MNPIHFISNKKVGFVFFFPHFAYEKFFETISMKDRVVLVKLFCKINNYIAIARTKVPDTQEYENRR